MPGHFEKGEWKADASEAPKGTGFMNIIFSAEEKDDGSGRLRITLAIYPRQGFSFPKGSAIYRYGETLLGAMKTAAEARSEEEKAANRAEIRDMIAAIRLSEATR